MFYVNGHNVGIVLDANVDIDNVVICGDLNTDFSRCSSAHSQALTAFCEDKGICPCISAECADVDYTYENDFNNVQSTLDHFIVSSSLTSKIVEYFTVHEGDNLSDHSPVYMSIDVQCNKVKVESRQYQPRCSWSMATDCEILSYKETLGSLLKEIDIPVEAILCHNKNCVEHYDEVNTYHDKIVNACLSASAYCIPVGKKRKLAGWSEYVSDYKKKSILWYRIWNDNGKPGHGVLKDIMMQTKREYKKAVKWVKSSQDQLSSMRMADALHSSNSRDFWKEVKKKYGNNHTCPSVIDDVHGSDNIAALFCNKYKDLYNSVSFDPGDMDNLGQCISNRIDSQCDSNNCYCSHNINVGDVKRAVCKLKAGKSSGQSNIFSDHVLNGNDELYIHMSLLFNLMASHAQAPADMLSSTLIPIPKNRRKSLNSSDNYRSIALSSIFGKVLENIVIQQHGELLNTSNLQFGFKPGHSTTQLSFVVNEVIEYYNSRKSSCHVLLLDASRAFDRVNYIKLFDLLLSRGMCPSIIRLLLNMYKGQSLNVNWNGTYTEQFICTNGVKQGGVLSPILFCVYIDELLCRLEASKVGCYIGDKFMGSFGYADDVSLLAPSISAAKHMLSICEEYASEYDILFNASKSKHIVCNPENACSNRVADLKINGVAIKKVDSAIMLGSYIGKDSIRNNVSKARGDLVTSCNTLMSRFGSCSSVVLSKLFDSYCSSYYGCPLWNLNDVSLKDLQVVWRKCIRKIWKLDARTHCEYLPFISAKPEISVQLLMRFCTFFSTCIQSSNPVVAFCTRLAIGSRSIVADNVRLGLAYLSEGYDYLKLLDNKRQWAEDINITYCQKCRNEYVCSLCLVIVELCMVRDQLMSVNHLPTDDIDFILFSLCTDSAFVYYQYTYQIGKCDLLLFI